MPKFELQGYKKRTDRNWKLIADIMLYTLPLINGAIVTMPADENVQKWLLFCTNLLIVTFKAVSKFTVDEGESQELSDSGTS